MARAKTTQHRDFPIAYDYEGVRRALSEEYEQHGRIQISLSDYYPCSETLFRLNFPPGTLSALSRPITEGWTVDTGLGGVRGRVVTVDEDGDRLFVRFSTPRRGHVFSQRITLLEPDFLLRFREWLDDNVGRPLPPLWGRLKELQASPMKPSDLGLGETSLAQLRTAQLGALLQAQAGLSYLWGPPGTGKTHTMARLVQSLLARDYKVMILAPTNVAVDTALLAIYNALTTDGTEPEGGYLVRAGYPQLEELKEYPVLLAWQELLKNQQSVLDRIERELKQVQQKLTTAQDNERDELLGRLAELRTERTDSEQARQKMLWALAKDARVLATTVHSALHVKEVLAFMSTSKLAVLVDEAGMVPRFALLPLLEILGGAEGIQQGQLQECPSDLVVSFAGDPKQLAPIFREGNSKDVNRRYWLGQSLMEELLEQTESTPRQTLLDEQSRMDDSICSRISKTYYQGALSTVASDGRPIPPVCHEWPEDGLVLLDPSQGRLPFEAPGEALIEIAAKFNERSMWVGMGLIKEALAFGKIQSVLWVTPFRDQAQSLRKLADTYFSEVDIRVGTVHTSQGSEADLVIFDLVSPSHMWLKGMMGDEIDIERLLNVGVSRGRGQVIVLGAPGKVKTNRILWRLLHDAYIWTPSGAVRDAARVRPRVRVRRV